MDWICFHDRAKTGEGPSEEESGRASVEILEEVVAGVEDAGGTGGRTVEGEIRRMGDRDGG